MEYSDLMITLLRALGIPARAAFGYTYDPRDDENQESQEGHQWLEAYMPGVGWVSIDPTWGDSARREYIGPDIDHAYWYVAGENVNSPSQVSRVARGISGGPLESIEFEIEAISNVVLTRYQSQGILLSEYPYSPESNIPLWEDLSGQGRRLVIVVLVILVISVGYSIYGILKSIMSKQSQNTLSKEPVQV
jgi:hypothetical protein